ncbi:hypothetical protein ABB37_01174 [Leptomonas pyrrhocoris]|uniref:CRAL-TRIO domain-containing protein n=1 Tax=Leptomonas pyrrhocoris TaxID=157538 RepID=A0A0N0DZ12_LEPPY|nr:hypothetical protein ABB37_01174 [Leptomonas pyrrhocoris]KPA84662.1 hypothetical protein ABB37_01174 [Leptomonas pyrrhocoris]|eukprot:XP_015663101.1 hypothetical protein ABB37_01174 [Leptomonas pyrrhocoris]
MVKVEDIPESVPEMATLTAEKEELIQEFSRKVDELFKEKTPFYIARESTAEKRRIFGYKFLTARRWKVKNALDMVEKTVAFRAQHNMDDWKLFPCAFPLKGYDEGALCEMLKTIPGCDALFPREGVSEVDLCYRALQTSYVNVYHYWDKEGHPVLYDCCGRANVAQLLHDLARITPPGKSLGDVIVPYHTYMNEVQYYLIEYADQVSKQAGKHPIMGITVVMDMEGLSFKVVRRSFIQIVRAIFEVDQAYYPEVLHRLFILNAPRFFRMAYDFVKGSLDENTRRKLVISSDKRESLEILKRVIDEDKIPQELGGSCRCESGCLPRYVKPTTTEAASESGAGSSVASDEDVQKEDIHLKAGKEWSHAYALLEGEEVTWQFTVSKDAEVDFTAVFEPKTAGNSEETASVGNSVSSKKGSSTQKLKGGTEVAIETLKHEKLSTDVDTFKVTRTGTLTLTLSNKHSWMHGKQIDLRITHTKALE